MEPPAQIPVQAMESIEETQQNTQTQTQELTQSQDVTGAPVDGHLWAFLQPCSDKIARIDLFRIKDTYQIGRLQEGNDISLPGPKISARHCRIHWNGQTQKDSVVTLLDTSSNGTWVSGERVLKKHKILHEGNEIAFGTLQQDYDRKEQDFRFIFRHLAGETEKSKLWKHYDIGNELGKGSFATVMRAMLRGTGQWFAVKMISRTRLRNTGQHTGAGSEANERGLLREITILEKLQHPNICYLRETFFDEININLVLEYVDGGDLLEYIVKNDSLSEDESRHISYQVCDALAYVHRQGIAHRDLKPENILLTKTNPPNVKVADFGLAKVVDSMTMLKTMCGTPAYLAPEVVLQIESEGYDHNVDSWSVGVIVFSMLTNCSPFREDTTQDIRLRVQSRTIDWSCIPEDTSDHVKDFMVRLLQYQPKDRMSLTDSLHHPWLVDYSQHVLPYLPEQVVQNPLPLPTSDTTPSVKPDHSMADALDDMSVDGDAPPESSVHVPGAFPDGTPNANGEDNGLRRHGSGLQRRGDVVRRAEEEGEDLLQPSQNQGQGGKRKHAESPAPPGDDAQMESPEKPQRKGKGRAVPPPANGKAPRARHPHPIPDMDPLRRSARNAPVPQKMRRAT